MELFLIYLWLKLDSLVAFCVITSIILLFAYGILWGPRSAESLDSRVKNYPEEFPLAVKLIKWHPRILVVGLVLSFLGGVLPSSRDVAILVGASVAIDVAKSPEGVKIGHLLRGKANELLDAELSKLNKAK